VLVGRAIGALGDDDHATDWVMGIKTVLAIISNIIKHPGNVKYYKINTTNPTFHHRFVLTS